jgi:peptidoglycan hydrolase-like protein with peptidoglycan-binding domain
MTWHLELNDPIDAAVAEAMAPDAVITPDGNAFRQGDRDAGPNGTIRSAQTNMIRLGLDGIGEVDGVYGRNTMNGVQDAQEMFGLPRTGVLDQATQDAFNNLTDDQIAFFTSETEAVAATPVAAVEEETNQTEVSTSFATIISGDSSTEVAETPSLRSGFDSLVEAEGTSIHLDGRGFLTLPYGIVPDANSVKKADGTVFDPTGSHGLTSSNLSGVDYAGATKFGISKTSYDTDEAFAKAVYSEFATRTASKYGEGFDGLTDTAKQAAYDMAWNAGIGSAGWSSVKTMLDEASKEGARSTENLIGFTTNFRSGSDYPRGLLKRRLQTYNLVANEGEEASAVTTSAVSEGGVRTGTTYTAKTSDGTVLATYTKPDNNEKLGTLTVE